MIGLAGGGYTRRQGLRRLKERLEKEAGFSAVRYRPSRLRPRVVFADVSIETVLGKEFPRDEGRLEVTWRPRTGRDLQRVHWADAVTSFGWHKDDDHESLGPSHFQITVHDETYHESASLTAEAPLSFLEGCLEQLPETLRATRALPETDESVERWWHSLNR